MITGLVNIRSFTQVILWKTRQTVYQLSDKLINKKTITNSDNRFTAEVVSAEEEGGRCMFCFLYFKCLLESLVAVLSDILDRLSSLLKGTVRLRPC